MLVARGILVKVNSVMIPGVNDEHLKEVSRVVKSKGAFLHNVMPLISELSTAPSLASWGSVVQSLKSCRIYRIHVPAT